MANFENAATSEYISGDPHFSTAKTELGGLFLLDLSVSAVSFWENTCLESFAPRETFIQLLLFSLDVPFYAESYGRDVCSRNMTAEREPRRRRRPALSCVECRRRKIKCDRDDPCGHCKTSRIHCVYNIYGNTNPVGNVQPSYGSSGPSPPSPSARTAHPSSADLASGRAVSEQAGRTLTHDGPVVPQLGTIGTPLSVYDNSNQARSGSDWGAHSDVHSLIQRVQKLEESAASSPASKAPDVGHRQDALTSPITLQEAQITLNKTRILGWSRWAAETSVFSTILDLFHIFAGTDAVAVSGYVSHDDSFSDPSLEPIVGDLTTLYQRCKALAKSTKVGRPSRTLRDPDSCLAPPSREWADNMANLYFKYFESTYRILHVPTFWAEYHRYWEDPGHAKAGTRLKVLLVIAIGSSLREHGAEELQITNRAHRWIYTAHSWLSGPLEKDRLDLTGIQVFCLTILARQIFSIGGDLVWMSMGDLIHRGMRIGLHRDPKFLPPMPTLQAETRRRLWATILELTLQSSMDASMPPRISFEEFDTEPPSNINDDEMDETTTDLAPHPRSTYTSASMQLILVDSLRARLRVAQLINGLTHEISYTDVLALSSEVMDACGAYGDFLRKQGDDMITAFHRNFLDYLLRRCLALVHCPFAFQARSNPLYCFSRKTFVEVAMTIVSPEPDDAFAHLLLIGGGLFREGIRYATTAISLELIDMVNSQKRDGTLARHYRTREVLKQTIRDMIELSADRIRRGETNTKMHTYLSAILGQVEAIETDGPIEYTIAKAARDSMEFCCNLVEERVGSIALSDLADIDTGMSVDGSGDGFDWDFDFEMNFGLMDDGFSFG